MTTYIIMTRDNQVIKRCKYLHHAIYLRDGNYPDALILEA